MGNPKYCRGCFGNLYRKRGGAEIECSLLFADVRGSTALAESMRPIEYRRLLDRFYATAFGVLVAHDAFVDKFVGDEVIGIVPALTETLHAREAVTAAVELLEARGIGTDSPGYPSASASTLVSPTWAQSVPVSTSSSRHSGMRSTSPPGLRP